MLLFRRPGFIQATPISPPTLWEALALLSPPSPKLYAISVMQYSQGKYKFQYHPTFNSHVLVISDIRFLSLPEAWSYFEI